MGIDRSDVRCVVHAAMPKSVEHYQQETGRAGRDGLAAECVLLHSPADALRWRTLLERGAGNRDDDGGGAAASHEGLEASLQLLDEIRRFCAPGRCRHKSLSEYFGQAYRPPNGEEGCGACDVCLGETEGLVDGSRDAQMILSCVARVGQRYGMGHVVDVLRGADTQRIRALGHERLSTWGLMKDRDRKELMNLTFQLLDQELLSRSGGEYPVLCLNEASAEVLRGERSVHLVPIKVKRARTTAREAASWEGVDRDLFERLRELRTELARARNVPPYVIFSDASLRDMARQRPATPGELLEIHGVGEKKLADLGDDFLACIREHAEGAEPGSSPGAEQGSSPGP
jgi:ATP-dependent DNA helicase RecQ